MSETNTAYIYFCEKMRPIIIEKIGHDATNEEMEQYLEHMWKESNETKDMSYDVSNTLLNKAHTHNLVLLLQVLFIYQIKKLLKFMEKYMVKKIFFVRLLLRNNF